MAHDTESTPPGQPLPSQYPLVRWNEYTVAVDTIEFKGQGVRAWVSRSRGLFYGQHRPAEISDHDVLALQEEAIAVARYHWGDEWGRAQ